MMVVEIIFGVVTLLAMFVSYYFYVKGVLISAASGAIDSAEATDKVGEEKFKMVCEQLKSLIPAVMKPFINDTLIEVIVQGTFDAIESFAKKQVDRKE